MSKHYSHKTRRIRDKTSEEGGGGEERTYVSV